MRFLLVFSIVLLGACGGRAVHRQTFHPVSNPAAVTDSPKIAPAAVVTVQDPVRETRPEPPPVIEDTKPPRITLSELIEQANARLRDAFFAYDSFALDASASAAIQFNQSILRPLFSDFPKLELVIEGHCDERGSAEYNLGLGDLRAKRALDFLRELGLGGNLRAVSYGREKPQCSEPDESCWSRNRRAHFTIEPPPRQ